MTEPREPTDQLGIGATDMTDNTQPEALRLADALEYCDASVARQAINELRRQHARIAELEAQLSSSGFAAADMASASAQGFRDGVASLAASAGSEPVAPYAIDADPLGIRSTVADAITGALAFGAQGVNPPPEGHWLEPFWNAAKADRVLQSSAGDVPHGWLYSWTHSSATGRPDEDYTAFTQDEQYARNGVGHRDVIAVYTHPSPPEGMVGGRLPTFDMRAVVAVAVTMLYETHPEDVRRVFDLRELEKIVGITGPLGSQQVEDIYRSAWDHLDAPPTMSADSGKGE